MTIDLINLSDAELNVLLAQRVEAQSAKRVLLETELGQVLIDLQDLDTMTKELSTRRAELEQQLGLHKPKTVSLVPPSSRRFEMARHDPVLFAGTMNINSRATCDRYGLPYNPTTTRFLKAA